MSGSYYAALFSVMVVFLLLPLNRAGTLVKLVCLSGLLILALLPFDGINLAMAVRALTGDISITAFFWLACACVNRSRTPRTKLSPSLVLPAASLVVLGALFLYPASLGLSQWDPYRLGYHLPLALCCGALVALCCWRRYYFAAMAISLALAARAGDLLESSNLWDYLLDPWLAIYCFYYCWRQRGEMQRVLSKPPNDAPSP